MNLTEEEKKLESRYYLIDDHDIEWLWRPKLKIAKLVWATFTNLIEDSKTVFMADKSAPCLSLNHTAVMIDMLFHVTVSCEMDFAMFPFDEQRCLLRV